jgi:hypothetical protein
MGIENIIRNVKMTLLAIPFVISSCAIQKDTISYDQLIENGSAIRYNNRLNMYEYFTQIPGTDYFVSGFSKDRGNAISKTEHKAKMLEVLSDRLKNYDDGDKIISPEEFIKIFNKYGD